MGVALHTTAQITGNGYYRVQNKETGRYIELIDNRGKVDYVTTTVDLGALQTISGFDQVVGNPATVFYFTDKGSRNYNLSGQGCDLYGMIGYYLELKQLSSGAYRCSKTVNGALLYLADEEGDYSPGMVVTTGQKTRDWYVRPITADGDNYFGLKPEVSARQGLFTTIYAAFPFAFAAEGMEAYTVTKVDRGMAVYKPLTGTVVPAATPVIVKCAGSAAADNKLNLLTATDKAPAGNLLRGVYFNNGSNLHNNQKAYNRETMRVLGTLGDGTLGLVTANYAFVPANHTYVEVPAGTSTELKLVTQAEYDAAIAAGIGATEADATVAKAQGIYAITGAKLRESAAQLGELPAGLYIVDGVKTLKK